MIRTRVAVIVGLGLLVGALALTLPGTGAGSPAPTKRTIYMAAVEPKGGTAVTAEAFPATPLPQGPGYVLKAPDASGRWEVSAYQWQPGFILAQEGDDVTLEILGINGAEHQSLIEGINVPAFNVKRGQITTVNFRAPRQGFYRIVCSAHLPTMVGYLVVLPRR
ncbi:MAG: hypothetical protein ACT4PY_10390 [Armatimonadota bacterium]